MSDFRINIPDGDLEYNQCSCMDENTSTRLNSIESKIDNLENTMAKKEEAILNLYNGKQDKPTLAEKIEMLKEKKEIGFNKKTNKYIFYFATDKEFPKGSLIVNPELIKVYVKYEPERMCVQHFSEEYKSKLQSVVIHSISGISLNAFKVTDFEEKEYVKLLNVEKYFYKVGVKEENIKKIDYLDNTAFAVSELEVISPIYSDKQSGKDINPILDLKFKILSINKNSETGKTDIDIHISNPLWNDHKVTFSVKVPEEELYNTLDREVLLNLFSEAIQKAKDVLARISKIEEE